MSHTIVIPAVVMLIMISVLSFVGATVLSKQWMRRVAFCLGLLEAAGVIFLLLL